MLTGGMQIVREREIKDDANIFVLSNQKEEVAVSQRRERMRAQVWGVGVAEEARSLIWAMLS